MASNSESKQTLANDASNVNKTEQPAGKGMAKFRISRTTLKTAGIGLTVLVIFGAGVLVGNGSIMVNRYGTQNGQLPSKLNYTTVNQVYQALKANYDGNLSESQLLDGLKGGLVQATGDPYTDYFTPAAAKQFNDQIAGTFSGIGAELGKDADSNLIVISPINGSPADKAGLKAKDIISEINGASTANMSTDDAVNKIRGKKGTKVTLQVIRNGQTQNITITRDDITVPSVTYKILDNNVGYLQINEFGDDTTKLAIQAAQNFKDNNVKSVVLDLRGDPGGLLDAAVSVSSLWLPTGTKILDEKRGDKVIQTYTANGNDLLHGLPTAVLIDGGSASAAEITAGALKDNNAATLVGEKSFGKGSVQELVNFADGGALKVTIARWYRPNGQNIDKKGITPDKQVSISADNIKNGQDPQKDAAISTVLGQ
ncbi:MAG TPA: S41 family peptidase [Candidatus Saccharimonadales bacterium]|nr:S41 family peptidase [Candidatus Saccharimonadales bacterium]